MEILKKLARKEMENQLKQVGFVKHGRRMIRCHNDSMHFIEMQGGMAGFTFNLGYHYDFLPSFQSFMRKPAPDLTLTELLMWGRIGYFLPGIDRDIWWSPEDFVDVDVVTYMKDIMARASNVLMDRCRIWNNRELLLCVISPRRLALDVPLHGLEKRTGGDDVIPLIWDVLPGWIPDRFKMAYFLCHVSLALGKRSIAQQYADVGLKSGANKSSKDQLIRLLKGEKPCLEG